MFKDFGDEKHEGIGSLYCFAIVVNSDDEGVHQLVNLGSLEHCNEAEAGFLVTNHKFKIISCWCPPHNGEWIGKIFSFLWNSTKMWIFDMIRLDP